MKNFTKNIVFLFILIAMFQQSLSQESGWTGEGVIKYQKFPTDSIVKYGLSPDGDTLKTFHRGGKLYYWDIKSGNLIKEKQLPEGIKVSEDMMTYFKYRDSIYSGSSLNSRVYASDVSVFDIYNDVTIFSTGFIKLAEAQYTEFYRQFTDFSFNHKKFFIVLSSRYYTVVVDQTNVLSYSINFTKDSIYIDSKTFPLAAQCIYNNRFDKILYMYSTSYWGRHSEGGSSNVLGFFDINKNENTTINNSYYSGIYYKNPRFLNDNNKVSAFNSRKLSIWQLKPIKKIDEHIPIKGYDVFSDYLFIKEDNFLAYSNYKIYIYDMKSKRIIDSSDVINSNKNTYLQYSTKNDILCFFNGDKFGIFESSKLNNIGNLNISVDSNHVYTGKPYNVYLYGVNDNATVKWETSDGQTSNERNPIFRFDSTGYISFTVTVNDNGTEYQKTFENVLIVLPMLVSDFDSDVRFGSAPLNVKFRNLSKGSNLTYEWSFGNGKTSTEKDPIMTYESAGRYHVSLKIKDSLNNITKSKPFYIQIDSDIYEPLEITNDYFIGSNTVKIINGMETKEYRNLLYSIGTIINISGIFSVYSEYEFGGFSQFYTIKLDENLILQQKSNKYNGLNRSFPKILEYKNSIILPTIYYGRFVSFNSIDVLDINNINELKILSMDNIKDKINIDFITESSFIVSINPNDTTNYEFKVNDNQIILKRDTLKSFSKDIVKVNSNEIYNVIFKKSENKHYIYVTDTNLIFIRQLEIANADVISFNTFALLKNGKLAFGGNTKDSISVFGVMKLDGEIEWTKTNKNWKTFQRIKVLEKSFQLLGENFEKNPGFIEIDYNGTQFKDYRINRESSIYTCDIDIWDSNTLLLTYKHGDYLHCVSKVKYSPLFAESTPNDTTKTDSTTNRIKSINPNPAHSEITIQFFKELIPIEIQIYNSEGLLVDSKNLSKEKTTEISHNIQKLSIGIYFVKVITQTEILEGKFIKY